jgi:F-type H+-transporting ATPase subunit epsilon
MAGTFQLEVATPERLLVREQVSEVQVPAANGYLGILPEHAALLAPLGTGVLSYVVSGHRRSMAIANGYLEVLGGNARVLADVAENADEIDVKRAETALRRAEDRLSHPDVALDVARALNAAKRAQARLETARGR